MKDGWPTNSVGDQKLTRREAEVAGLVSQGLANKVVAWQLGVREGTVKIHLHNIYRKLRVSNRIGLIVRSASGTMRTSRDVRLMSALGGKADIAI